MNESKHPSEIAREALKRLVLRQLPPTPANYQACYNEIADLPNLPPFPEAPLRELSSALLAGNEQQEIQLDKLSAAIARRSWLGVKEALVAFAMGAGMLPRNTRSMLRSLFYLASSRANWRVLFGVSCLRWGMMIRELPVWQMSW